MLKRRYVAASKIALPAKWLLYRLALSVGLLVTSPSVAQVAAQLSDLSLSEGGGLSPAFSPSQTTYSTTVPAAASSVFITARTQAVSATLTIDGVAVRSGVAHRVLLVPGDNSTRIVVTNTSFTSTYNLTITRFDLRLTALSVIGGTLTPSFDPNRTRYNLTPGLSLSNFIIRPSFSGAGTTATVNGIAVTSGQQATVPFGNSDSIEIILRNGTNRQVYNLAVSAGLALSGLQISSGTLTPAFSTATTEYTAAVTVRRVDITATLRSAAAQLTIDGGSASSGIATPVMLESGENTISIVVSSDEARQTYRITFTATGIALTGLSIADTFLFPDFHARSVRYETVVPDPTTLTLTLTFDAPATVTIQDEEVTSGTPMDVAPEVVREELVIFINVADMAGDSLSYSILVGTSDSQPTLSALSLSLPDATSLNLSPAFSPSTTSYAVTISGCCLQVIPTVGANTESTVLVNGRSVSSGSPSDAIETVSATSEIFVQVTAEEAADSPSEGSFAVRRIYRITVTRSLPGAPAVSRVSGISATYRLDKAIPVFVDFSEPVNVTGTPTLALATGAGRTALAHYDSGSGTTRLTFTYRVRRGDGVDELNYTATTALALAGGTIRDGESNNASLALPALDSTDSLAGTSNIRIQIDAAGIVRVDGSDGLYDTDDSLTIRVFFDREVEVSGTTTDFRLLLDTGNADSAAVYTSGSGSSILVFTYTVRAGDSAEDLNYPSASALMTGDALLMEYGTVLAASAVLPDPTTDKSLAATSSIRIGNRSAPPAETQRNLAFDVIMPRIAQAMMAGTVNVLTKRFENRLLDYATSDQSHVYAQQPAATPVSARPGLWLAGHATNLSDSEKNLSYDGDVYALSVGFDREIDSGVVAGISFHLSDADFTYGRSSEAGGDITYEVVTFNPYVNLSISRQLSFWGMAGYGEGAMTITADDTRDKVDIDHLQVATGIRYQLLNTARGILHLKGDLAASHLAVPDTASNASLSDLSVFRGRIFIEAFNYIERGGHVISPAITMGARLDSGDGDSGAGAELAGSLSYSNPAGTFWVETGGHYLFAGLTDEWGARLLLRFNLQRAGTGLAFSLGPAFGDVRSRAERPWTGSLKPASASARAHLATQIAYGFRLPVQPRMVLTPYARLNFARDATGVELGNRLHLGQRFDLAMKARQSIGGRPELLLEAHLRF